VVSYRRVDPGNVIAGGSNTAEVLTTVVSTNPIHFVFDASEGQFLKYQRETAGRGKQVKIRLQDETEDRWTGTLDFADNALDDGTGAVRMRAVIANPNGFLKPGLFGRAHVEGTSAYTALLIPEAAISSDGARKVVMTVAKDGTVGPKVVELGPLSGDLRVVRSGLRPDDQVIVGGGGRVMPGQKAQTKLTPITRAAPKAEDAPTTVSTPSAVATPAG
jgi:RND family efflux transporter MFP subunit